MFSIILYIHQYSQTNDCNKSTGHSRRVSRGALQLIDRREKEEGREKREGEGRREKGEERRSVDGGRDD